MRTYTVENVEDFKIFMAAPEITPECNRMIAEKNQENLEFLAKNPQKNPKMQLSGSFIFAHAPNYVGKVLLHFSESDWEKLFNKLRSFGVDCAIFQAALWAELEECYYPSKIFSHMKTFNVLDPMLKAAEQCKMKIFLGGYGSVTGWRDDLDSAVINQETSNQFKCFNELYERYKGRFQGFYFTPETAFDGVRNLAKESLLNQLYRNFCGMIKQKAPELQIMMSPGTKFHPGKLTEMEQCWNAILHQVPLDIMAPQDSIGCCGNTLSHQIETFQVWQKICQAQNIKFWSNVEVFERKANVMQLNHSVCAPLNRIKAQMNHAQAFADKLISWELVYYTTFEAGSNAADLADFLEKSGK